MAKEFTAIVSYQEIQEWIFKVKVAAETAAEAEQKIANMSVEELENISLSLWDNFGEHTVTRSGSIEEVK